jgi:uncharacterized repeat protein (TIGR01451 family)
MATIDLQNANNTTTIDDVTFIADPPTNSGTGQYFTFLAVQDNSGTEEGYNSEGGAYLDADASKTKSLAISQLEVRNIGGVDYYIIRMDMNEPGNANSADAPIQLTEFKLYVSGAAATQANYNPNQDGAGDGGLNLNKFFDLDFGGDNTLLLKDRSSGSGSDDYEVRIPVSKVPSGDYLTLYFKFTGAQSGFEEARALTKPFVAAPAIDVTKTVTSVTDGSDFGAAAQADSAGDVINYGISIKNTGNVALTGVTATDQVQSYAATPASAVMAGAYNAGDANSNGKLDVGETWQYTATYTVTQADLDGEYTADGKLVNVATGDTAESLPDTATASVSLVYAAGLDVTKTVASVLDGADHGASNQADSAGDVINYAINVTNNGNVRLTGVTVTDQVQAYAATNATAVMTGAFNAGDANQDGELDVGETWQFTSAYTLTQADLDGEYSADKKLDNLATADSTESGADTATASVNLAYNAALDVTKTVTSVLDGADHGASNQADSAGDVINYAINVTNNGNVRLTGVTVTDQVQAYAATNATAVMTGGFNAGDANQDGELDVGETWQFTSAYTLTQADLDGEYSADKKLDNLATADSTESGADTATASVSLVYAAGLDVTKTVASVVDGADHGASNQADSAGDVINYAINVTNNGNVRLTGVTVTDQVQAYAATNATAVMTGGFNAGDANQDGELDVGETWQFTSAYTLTQADLDSEYSADKKLDNLATADSTESGADTATASVNLAYNAALDVTKTVTSVVDGADFGASGQVDSAGDLINYAITVTNNGNVRLTGVTVTDQVQAYAATNATAVMTGGFNAGDANQDGELDVGETWQFTSAYTVVQGDLDGRGGGDNKLDNVAAADSAESPADTASASAALVYSTSIDVEKSLRVNGGAWQDVDTPTGPTARMKDDIDFQFVVTNTSNVTLTNVQVNDSIFDLNGAAAGKTWTIGSLAPGASATLILGDDELVPFTIGQHANTATATGSFGATSVQDADMAHYWGVVGEGLSHGYWKNHASDWDIGAPGTNSFEAFFGVNLASWVLGSSGKKAITAADITFEQALALTGGGVQSLAREAVAAVLNYYDEDISYGYDLTTIINMVKTAFASGDYESTKILLENENTSGNWFV